MLLLPHKRLPYGIFEWSVRGICHQHPYAVAVNRTIHIPFPIAIHDLLSPRTVITVIPFEVLERCHGSPILPVYHVGRGIEEPVFHQETLGIILVVGGVEIDGVVHNHRRRVGGVFRLHKRHVELRCRIDCERCCGEHGNSKVSFVHC